MNPIYAILGIVGFLLIVIISIYNSLVRLRNQVRNSWSGIDVQLKRRNDLIPNLVNTVKGYAKHEKELLEHVTQARANVMESRKEGDLDKLSEAENELSGTLKSLFAVAENYPDLKANQNFLKLQEQITETEDQIAASRRIYNENVTYYNNKIETFPSNIFANMFNFEQKNFFETKDRENVKISF